MVIILLTVTRSVKYTTCPMYRKVHSLVNRLYNVLCETSSIPPTPNSNLSILSHFLNFLFSRLQNFKSFLPMFSLSFRRNLSPRPQRVACTRLSIPKHTRRRPTRETARLKCPLVVIVFPASSTVTGRQVVIMSADRGVARLNVPWLFQDLQWRSSEKQNRLFVCFLEPLWLRMIGIGRVSIF